MATAESRADSSSAEGKSASAAKVASVDAWHWRTDAQVNYVVAWSAAVVRLVPHVYQWLAMLCRYAAWLASF